VGAKTDLRKPKPALRNSVYMTWGSKGVLQPMWKGYYQDGG